MRGLLTISARLGSLCLAAAVTLAAVPAAAQTSYSPYAESASDALARYVRTLASSPRDFSALIGAGRSALALGDTQAAAGFFARADEVSPRSPLPQAGMGAVSVANGDPRAALPYFARAQQLGAPVATFGADRGLAYDLLGRQAEAQSDYRAALGGADSDEARRRLALSLAISGNRNAALEALAPLMARRDGAAARCRAFVLALTGDANGAMIAFDSAMPGSWSRVSPFLQRLPALHASQKAAAVNLGIFPDANAPAYAYGGQPSVAVASTTVTGDRLAEIDQLLRAPAPQPAAQQPSWSNAPVTQVAYSLPAPSQVRQAPKRAEPRERKIWLQLASGPNAKSLPGEFRQIKSTARELLDGIKGYVARSPDRTRLVIGPFKNTTDAETFAQGLESYDVDAFRWTNTDRDTIVPLGTE